jgi:protein-tyrosine phosphatase
MSRQTLMTTTCLFAALVVGFSANARPTSESVERLSPTKVAVAWKSNAPVDVYMLPKANTTGEGGRLVVDDSKKGRAEIDVAATERPYFLLKDTSTGEVVLTAERVVPLEQGSNFRDLGGYTTKDGKSVKWGMVYRSGGTPLLSLQDLKQVAALNLTDMVDLRSSEERVIAPTRINGVKYEAVGYSMLDMMGAGSGQSVDLSRMDLFYRRMPDQLAPQFKVLFESLLEPDSVVAYNCSAGQDRTGIASALFLTALGVPRDVVVADYHLSTQYRLPQNEMPKIDPALAESNPVAKMFAGFAKDPRTATPQPLYDGNQKSLVLWALEEIDTKYGSVEGYLNAQLGVGPKEIAALRAKYLQ